MFRECAAISARTWQMMVNYGVSTFHYVETHLGTCAIVLVVPPSLDKDQLQMFSHDKTRLLYFLKRVTYINKFNSLCVLNK